MRGVVFLGERKLELQEFPDPAPGPGEVVLAIKASGMCGSDLHPYRAVGNAAASLGLGSGGPVIALGRIDTMMAGHQDNGGLWLERAMLLRACGRNSESAAAKRQALRLWPHLAPMPDTLPALAAR